MKVDIMNMDILVVDDVEISARLYTAILEKEGYNVHYAAGGLDAISMITTEQLSPALIITDVMMPGFDGFQFIDKMKQNSLLTMPFIFISARADIADVEAGLAVGAKAYLLKPINAKMLVKKVNSICRPEKI